jgi:hypothetical protein
MSQNEIVRETVGIVIPWLPAELAVANKFHGAASVGVVVKIAIGRCFGTVHGD